MLSFCYCSCYVFYNSFIIVLLFYNTTVNVIPLNHPLFEKFALHFRKLVFSYLNSYAFACLFFSLLMLGYPMPMPPWARLIPFLVDVSAILFDVGRSCRTTKEEITRRRLPSAKHSFRRPPCGGTRCVGPQIPILIFFRIISNCSSS